MNGGLPALYWLHSVFVRLEGSNFIHEVHGFSFQQGSLDLKILFRVLTGAEFEVEVAEILEELFLVLQEVVQASFLALAGEGVLRPECVEEQRKRQDETYDEAFGFRHNSITSVAGGFAAYLFAHGLADWAYGGGFNLAYRPAPDEQNGAYHGGQKDGEGRDPGDQVEAVGGGRGQHGGAVLGGELVEDLLVGHSGGDVGA